MLVLAGVVLIFGGIWSIGESVKSRTRQDLIRFHQGNFDYYLVKDGPVDANSRGLYEFMQLLDLDGIANDY